METPINDLNETRNVDENPRRNMEFIPTKKVKSCIFCDSYTHELQRCFKFRNKSYKERREFVRKQRLCDNCLKGNHVARNCRSNAACMISDCRKKHHSLLHLPHEPAIKLPNPGGDKSPGRENVAGESGNCSATARGNFKVCLRIVPVKVSNEDGSRELETYAFIDNGTDTTLGTRSLVEELNLPSKPAEFTLTTVNGQEKLSLMIKTEVVL